MGINGETKMVGILGHPVTHTLSPRMQNAAFKAMGLNIRYVPLHILPENLPAAVAGIRAMEFLGANVTIPHKVPVCSLLDRLDVSASRAGAVNTIVNREGLLEGHNTDGAGFIRALRETADIDLPAAAVVILGAGGAARSIAAALAEKGAPRLAIINRTRQRAEDLKALLNRDFPALDVIIRMPDEDLGDLLSASRLLINATSVGMEGHLKAVPLDVDRLTKDHVVCDIVYAAQETSLLVAAREKGATVMGGLAMLLHQGAASIHLWTGEDPPLSVMRNALES